MKADYSNKIMINTKRKVNTKTVTILTTMLLSILVMGCGNDTKVITGEKQTTQDSGAARQESGQGEETAQAAPADSEGGYTFVYDGLEMIPDMDVAPVLSSLGEPKSYFEAESCAFHGLDKIYTYAGFEVDTYPTDGKDYISNIILKDDTVSTKEGVSLYMAKEDMIAAYGGEYTEESGVFIYEKGGMKLCFIFSGDEIRSIEYRSKVLENE